MADKVFIVISDIRAPKISGIDLLIDIKAFDPHIEVIMITNYVQLDILFRCLEKGAFCFVQKPMQDAKDMSEIIQKAAESHKRKREMILKALTKTY